MKHIKPSILSVAAILSMGFTITNSKLLKKRVTITNCYTKITTTSGNPQFLSICEANPTWVTLNCVNKALAINKVVRNNLTVNNADFVDAINCNNASTIICCVKFRAQATDPCDDISNEKTGDGTIIDGTTTPVSAIGGFYYVIIDQIECRN